MKFQNRLIELRKSKKLSQPELSNLLNISDRTISAWERGINMPSIELIEKIADVFNVSTDFLLCREEKENDLTIDKDLLSLQRAYEMLTPKDKQRMLLLNRTAFEKAFSKEVDEDDTI